MYQDVIELGNFYRSPLGRVTAQLIIKQITWLWPDLPRIDVMGLGYTIPYLEMNPDHRIFNIMPAAQGVIQWPPPYPDDNKKNYTGNLTILAHEGNLPIGDAALDRIMMVHMLEHADHSQSLLREIWRILTPGGRVIIVVPNRVGFWARNDRTPFGHGTPYSSQQICQLLTDNMLTPTRTSTALHLMPFKSRLLRPLLTRMDGTLQTWGRKFAGTLIVEAEKQIYAIDPKARKSMPVRHPVIAGNNFEHSPKVRTL